MVTCLVTQINLQRATQGDFLAHAVQFKRQTAIEFFSQVSKVTIFLMLLHQNASVTHATTVQSDKSARKPRWSHINYF